MPFKFIVVLRTRKRLTPKDVTAVKGFRLCYDYDDIFDTETKKRVFLFFTQVQPAAHQTILRLCTALISRALALRSNCKCKATQAVDCALHCVSVSIGLIYRRCIVTSYLSIAKMRDHFEVFVLRS
jgi:hypothetical protein